MAYLRPPQVLTDESNLGKKVEQTKEDILERKWSLENDTSDFVPYRVQIDENTIKLASNDIIQTLKLQGVSHESAAEEDVLIWKDQLNAMLRNIASTQLSIWTHTVRREYGTYPGGDFSNDFDATLNKKYRLNLKKKKMMVNELYITIIYRPTVTKSAGLFSRYEKNLKIINQQNRLAIEKLNETVDFVLNALSNYGARKLTTYLKNDILHSELLEFFDFLANGDFTPRALPKKNIADCLVRNRVFFGAESLEIRGLTESRVASVLGILEYPEGTEAGLLNTLLSAPFPLILTQSFNFLSKPVAVDILQRQQRRMESTEDLARSQVDQISVALDDLTSNKFVFGEHHLSLTVFGLDHDDLKKNLSAAQTAFADTSMVVMREDWALAAAFWAQLPGNHRYRPRPSPISSINFAGFSSFHNFPTGDRVGNQWGSAVTMFKTTSGAPYYFNFHEPLDVQKSLKLKEIEINDGLGDKKSEQKALANTLIIGPSGSGKTVLQGFLISQAKKFNATQIIFDKDRGLDIFIRVSGGVYLPLEIGKPTGFNPFQLPYTEANISFLTIFVKKCAGGEFNTTDEKELDLAVRGVMGLDKPLRIISRCLEFLDPTSENGTFNRLSKWCKNGSLSWVFNNDKDVLDLNSALMFGFDVTAFLDNKEIRTPLIMYLFHRIEEILDGRRVMIFLDEFWRLLADEYFEDFANNKQKVIRKQNGLMVYGTQSAKDVLSSPIAHTLIEQCATIILMPNPKAIRNDYIEGLHLTEREFELISRDISPGSRSFLIKKGHSSVVADLDLAGFDNELAVISGTTYNVHLVDKLIAKLGTNPSNWLSSFHAQRN